MSWTTANTIAQTKINRGIEEAKAFGITDPVKAREIADRYWIDYNKTGDEKWLHLAHWAESVCIGAKELARIEMIAQSHTATMSECDCEYCTA